MSLSSWKKEFYPVTAHSAVKKLKLNDVQLVDHALLKWEGLKPHNLLKHDLESHPIWHVIQRASSVAEFNIDANSCSLCVKYFKGDVECTGCPLFESLGGVRCDKIGYPYSQWTWGEGVTSMLKALRKAKKWAEKNG